MAGVWCDNFGWFDISEILRIYDRSDSISGGTITLDATGGSDGGPSIAFATHFSCTIGKNSLPTTGNTFIAEWDHKISTHPATRNALLGICDGDINSGSSVQISIQVDTAGKFRAYRGFGGGEVLLGTSTYVWPTDTHIRIGVKVVLANSGGSVLVGVMEPGDTTYTSVLNLTAIDTQETANATWNGFTIGAVCNGSERLSHLVLMDGSGSVNNDRLGQALVYDHHPNAPGFSTAWSVTGAASNYLAVDEDADQDDDTTYVSSSTLNADDLYEFTDTPYTDQALAFTVLAITARRIGAGSDHLKPLLRVSGSTTVGSAYSVAATTYTAKLIPYDIQPSAAIWTPAAWNAAQWGYRRNSTEDAVRVTQVVSLIVILDAAPEEEQPEPVFIDGEVSVPLARIDFHDKGGTPHNFAEVDLNDRTGYTPAGYSPGWVQQFLPITRGLSDIQGQGERLSFGAVFSDAGERFWRELLDHATNKVVRGRPLAVWMIGDEERRAEALWRLLAAGFVTGYSFPPNLQFELRGGGWIDWKFPRTNTGTQSWQPLIKREDFEDNAGLDDAILETPVPIPYSWLASFGSRRPGTMIPIYTGQRDGRHEFLISRLACKSVDALYVDNVVLSGAETAANWYIPGNAKWTGAYGTDGFRDFNGRRYTVIYGDVGATIPDAVAAGESILGVNVYGIESVGDCSGDVLFSMVDQLEHFMGYFVAREDTSTDVIPYPAASSYTFPHIAGLSLIDTASLAQAKQDLADRLGVVSPQDDYEGRVAIGADSEVMDIFDVIARWAVSCDFDWYYNRKGQFAISVEPIAAVAGSDPVTDVLTIVEDSFSMQDDDSVHYNILPHKSGRIYGGRDSIEGWQRWDSERAEDSIDLYGPLTAPAFELWHDGYGVEYILMRYVLFDVMYRKRCRYQNPMRRVTFEGPLSLLSYECGDIVPLTHIEGIGASGWVGRKVRITRHEVHASVGRVRIDAYDMEPIWAANAAGSPGPPGSP